MSFPVIRTFLLLREGLKALSSVKGRAILMMLGVIIGIASLTVIVSIGEATKLEILNLMSSFGFGVDALYIRAGGGRLFHRRAGGNPKNLTLEDAKALGSYWYVREVVPQQSKGGVVTIFKNKKKDTFLLGVFSNWGVSRNWPVVLGRFISDADVKEIRKVCVLGESVRKKLFGTANPVGEWIRVRKGYYKVIGVMKVQGFTRGGHDLDNRIFMPISVTSKIILHTASLSGFRVNLISKDYLPQAVKDFRRLLRGRHHLSRGVPDDFTIITAKEILDIITRQTRSLTRMLAWISGISLFVSAIVIMNIMLVSVTERTKEIGIRRAVGASGFDILFQFLGESVIVAMAGGLAGLSLGYGLFKLISIVFDLASALSWKAFILAAFFSSLTGLVSGLFPAWKASRLSPIEAMR